MGLGHHPTKRYQPPEESLESGMRMAVPHVDLRPEAADERRPMRAIGMKVVGLIFLPM